MRTILCCATALILMSAFSLHGAPAARKKAPARKAASTARTRPAATVSGKKSSTARKKPVTTASARRSKTPAITWRNRQLAPTPDRYRDIQNALIAKGYLKQEDATGAWSADSVDALKRFQADQNLEASGKINSLSLIALGLGPKRDASAPPKPVEQGPDQDR